MEKQKIWEFIESQINRCGEYHKKLDYRAAIDIAYDIAGNIANLYLYLERSYFSTDKGKVLNTLSEMHKLGIFSQDYGKILQDKWKFRNLAKYGFFSSSGIEEIEINKKDVEDILNSVFQIFSEFTKYKEKYEKNR